MQKIKRITAAEYRKLLSGSQAKPQKYHNKTQWHDGLYFGSQKELNDYLYQKQLLQAGQIAGFLWQGVLVLTEGTDKENRAVTYRPDLVVFHNDGSYRIREVKGKRTQVYINKHKIILQRYPRIHFEEV